MTSTAGRSPRLKSLTPTPDGTRPAGPAHAPVADGAPKVVAEGVLSAVRPDPHITDGRTAVAWLHVSAPGRRSTPRAESWCACGRHVTAFGRDEVAALIETHTEHRDSCPLRTTATEGRQAA